jgi:hypothetical protein
MINCCFPSDFDIFNAVYSSSHATEQIDGETLEHVGDDFCSHAWIDQTRMQDDHEHCCRKVRNNSSSVTQELNYR